jgi:hypothetical protein
MTIQQLQRVRDASPFRPFVIHVADGRSFRVPHRDFVSHTPGGRTLIVYDEDDDEGFSILDLLLVTEIEMERNGARRRRRQAE